MAGRQEHEKKKTKNKDDSLKTKDSMLVSGVEGLNLSSECKKKKKKKKSEGHEDSIEDAALSSSLSEGNVDAADKGEKKEKKTKKKSERYGLVSSSLSDCNVDLNNAADKKKKKKKRKLEHVNIEKESQVSRKKNKMSEVREALGETRMRIDEGQDRKKEKKRKQNKFDDGSGDTGIVKGVAGGKGAGREESTEVVQDKAESSKEEEKKKKKKKKFNVVPEAASMQIMAETTGNQYSVIEGDGGSTSSIKNKARDGKLKVNAEGGNKRKKAKSLENHSKEKSSERVTETQEDAETTSSSEKSSSKETSKRVSFCEDVEIFPSSDGPSGKKAVGEDGLVRGKRFSHEEDEAVKEAVLNYINVHGLGADGLNMVLNCVKHPAIKHCWKEIGAALPWRPRESVYYRAHILFERDQNSSWTPEEYDLIRKFHEKHGSDWKTLAEALGKHRFHVKDTWRRIKLINMKKGKWSQDEYQFLFDSVNLDLRMKAFEERKTKHGMLRDNISWTAISEKLETRTDALCCQKWYDQLTSPMVAEGKWLDTDDYRLLMELYDLDACCMEDVDWDSLLEHRSGDLCRKRWNQMVKHLGDHRNKSFAEQVDVLINRYCPDVLDAREAYNSKPAVT